MDHFPLVTFAGNPYELGQAHGMTFREAIRAQVAETLAAAKATGGLESEAALAWAKDQAPRIHALGPHWIDELRGLADGAGISPAEAIALQVRPGTGFMPEGCTSFAASGDATDDGAPLAGQNRDLTPAYRPRMFLMRLRPIGRPPLLMHSVPGELGGVGMNAVGLSVFANSLWARSGRTWMAPPILRRAVLECGDAEEAAALIGRMDGPAVGNFLLADAAGRIRNVEVLPEGVAVIARDQGVYAHANNCTDAGLKPCEVEAARTPAPGTEGRRAWFQAALDERAGRLTLDDLKHLASDHRPAPEAICRHAGPTSAWETAATTIAQPSTGRLHISFGPPCEGRFVSHPVA
jgi:isopenicillin-N N-acyltransferase-like protein